MADTSAAHAFKVAELIDNASNEVYTAIGDVQAAIREMGNDSQYANYPENLQNVLGALRLAHSALLIEGGVWEGFGYSREAK